MQLHSLKMKGFRQFVETTVHFSDASFIIGQNNTGKSSILKAIDCLLKATDKMEQDDCLQSIDADGKKNLHTSIVELTGEFRDLPIEAKQWRGFKGRILAYTSESAEDSGLRIVYKKVFNAETGKCEKYLLQHPRSLKSKFDKCSKPKDFIDAGISVDAFEGIRDSSKFDTKLKDDELAQLDDIWDFDETQEQWDQNPGGIQQNVLSRLPHFLLIPAQDKMAEIGGSSGTLVNILQELFAGVRDSSPHYLAAKEHLDKLEAEFDPKNVKSELGVMMGHLNQVLGDVFPKAQINAGASLKNPDKVLSPEFEITMQSNIETPVSHQGIALIGG